jgi:predicted nucleic acid-binding protein
MTLFLDTNIIIDLIEFTREEHQTAVNLLNSILKNKYQIVISEDMLTTIFYLAKKDKLKALKFLDVIQKKWKIATFGRTIIKNAINISLKNNLDLEDVLQCLCAKNHQCDTIITNDKYFYDCGIKIQTASEFLNA